MTFTFTQDDTEFTVSILPSGACHVNPEQGKALIESLIGQVGHAAHNTETLAQALVKVLPNAKVLRRHTPRPAPDGAIQ
ncbi:hypothetical protein [Ereboglobus luteus]|uniref:hypothetical protein n=1 Tax=Ereboglobus luteus TaxID=1796921 RepID=UPI0012601BCC|nr:hypothetical protein [Ereboglobus luteus]